MTGFTQVILNPTSGGGESVRIATPLETLLRERTIPYRLAVTERPGHASDIAAEAKEEGAEKILGVGGDGTVHEIANGLLRSKGDPPPLTVLPVGTGNDFYKMIGGERGVEGAVDRLEHGVPKGFDVGMARWESGSRHFVNLLGFGIDVEVLRQRRRFHRLSGLGQYLAALVVAALRYRPIPLRLALSGGETIEDRVHLAAITVGPSAGGGFLLCPRARPDDGELDLCFIRALPYVQIFRYVPRVIRGTHEGLASVRMRRLTGARIEVPSAGSFFFQLDGELWPDPVEWLAVELEPARMTVMVSRESPR